MVSYGAGDGNRTHVRSLGSLKQKSESAELAAVSRSGTEPKMNQEKRDSIEIGDDADRGELG
jgi:hypothetical protein